MPKDYKADIKPKLSNRQGLKCGNHNYKSHYHVRRLEDFLYCNTSAGASIVYFDLFSC